VLAASLPLTVLLPALSTPPAVAASSKAAVRPHAGAWHFVNNNGSVKTARMTVRRGGVHGAKITVTPSKKSGCRRTTAASISGSFRIRGAGRGYRWHIGGSESANAPVVVTVHQHGVKTTGELFIGFRSRSTALGELVLGSRVSCDIFFGLKR
jgi:hypothetical protein